MGFVAPPYNVFHACLSQVQKNAQRIYAELAREEGLFAATLKTGQKKLDDLLSKASQSSHRVLSGQDAFLLYDSYGFPLELTQELAALQGIQVGFRV